MDKERSREKNIKEIKKIIIPVLRYNDVVKAGIFGSFVRGEQRKKSNKS